MKKNSSFYLRDMYDQTVFLINKFRNVSADDFFEEDLYQYASIRALEIIGEAVKNISNEYREKYPQIPWKNIAGMRDKLIHSYADVDVKMLWKTLVEDIPKLNNDLAVILRIK